METTTLPLSPRWVSTMKESASKKQQLQGEIAECQTDRKKAKQTDRQKQKKFVEGRGEMRRGFS
jgi:hypothetical protein